MEATPGPNLVGVSHVIFVFQHCSGAPNQEAEHYAANALVGTRMHDSLRLNGQCLEGSTMIITMAAHGTEAIDPIPVYSSPPDEDEGWDGFIETMEELSAIQSGPDVPPRATLWFVSRSISSLTCMLGLGWLGFTHRFAAWVPYIHLVYQVTNDWPAPDLAPAGDSACRGPQTPSTT